MKILTTTGNSLVTFALHWTSLCEQKCGMHVVTCLAIFVFSAMGTRKLTSNLPDIYILYNISDNLQSLLSFLHFIWNIVRYGEHLTAYEEKYIFTLSQQCTYTFSVTELTIAIHLLLLKTDFCKLITFIEMIIEVNAIKCIHEYTFSFKHYDVLSLV
jgi:hypothetical protein